MQSFNFQEIRQNKFQAMLKLVLPEIQKISHSNMLLIIFWKSKKSSLPSRRVLHLEPYSAGPLRLPP